MITMNNCNPSLINALSLCDFYSPKKAQPLITIFCMKWVVGVVSEIMNTLLISRLSLMQIQQFRAKNLLYSHLFLCLR